MVHKLGDSGKRFHFLGIWGVLPTPSSKAVSITPFPCLSPPEMVFSGQWSTACMPQIHQLPLKDAKSWHHAPGILHDSLLVQQAEVKNDQGLSSWGQQ